MAKAPERITLDELIRLVADNPKKAEAYFMVVEGDRPFAVNQVINPELVDFQTDVSITTLEDMRARGSFFISLGNEIGRRNRQADFRKLIGNLDKWLKGPPPRRTWVAEGDSWFHYPLFEPDDIVETLLLKAKKKTAIWTIAGAADELADMVAIPAYKDSVRGWKSEVLIFSGGGNDMLGGGDELAKRIRDFKPGDLPADMPNAEFDAGIDTAIGHFRTMFEDMTRHHPGVHVFTHGYDYAVPKAEGGKWLYPVMRDKGYPNPEFMWKVVKEMVDRFNVRLKKLAAEHRAGSEGGKAKTFYVDLRNTVVKKTASLSEASPHWHDEIHPNSKSFARVASKFAREIDAVLSKSQS